MGIHIIATLILLGSYAMYIILAGTVDRHRTNDVDAIGPCASRQVARTVCA